MAPRPVHTSRRRRRAVLGLRPRLSHSAPPRPRCLCADRFTRRPVARRQTAPSRRACASAFSTAPPTASPRDMPWRHALETRPRDQPCPDTRPTNASSADPHTTPSAISATISPSRHPPCQPFRTALATIACFPHSSCYAHTHTYPPERIPPCSDLHIDKHADGQYDPLVLGVGYLDYLGHPRSPSRTTHPRTYLKS